MWPYWLIFLIPAAAALGGRWLSPQTRPGWLALIAVLTLFIGYRHQVGGDWGSYIQAFEGQYRLSLYEVLSGGDPGYYLLNWLVIKSGGTIYTVNLICGLICAIGLAVFSRTQPRPGWQWLSPFRIWSML
ncbi:EpsG family protein [Spiribacter pallidus]|uniref:EpsG family protein n=1 Tax=Spiribacter pallidus TaxID=1987936 RepID=UPI0038B3A111